MIQGGKVLSLFHSNDTRWATQYDFLTHALDFREAIEEFVSGAIRCNPDAERDTNLPQPLQHDELMSEDWHIRPNSIDILLPLRMLLLIL